MPVDTFAIPFGPQQQDSAAAQEASAPGYYARRDFEARQQVELQPSAGLSDAYISAGLDRIETHANHQSSAQEIEDAILTPEQRAEKAAQWNLNEEIEDAYHPEVFDQMNQEAHHADSYYTQQRESVATPQAQEIVGVTYEAAQELSAHPEQNMPRLSTVGKLIVSTREEVVLTA